MDGFYNDILSSSDDENDEPVYRRSRILKERVDYFETMDDLDFFTRFRLIKNTVETLLIEIHQSLEHATERYVQHEKIFLKSNNNSAFSKT